jgi:hypothetical protein
MLKPCDSLKEFLSLTQILGRKNQTSHSVERWQMFDMCRYAHAGIRAHMRVRGKKVGHFAGTGCIAAAGWEGFFGSRLPPESCITRAALYSL